MIGAAERDEDGDESDGDAEGDGLVELNKRFPATALRDFALRGPATLPWPSVIGLDSAPQWL